MVNLEYFTGATIGFNRENRKSRIMDQTLGKIKAQGVITIDVWNI